MYSVFVQYMILFECDSRGEGDDFSPVFNTRLSNHFLYTIQIKK